MFVTWVAAHLRHNDPSSMKRHLPPFQTIDSGAQSYPHRRDCLTLEGAESFCESPGRGVEGVRYADMGSQTIGMEHHIITNLYHLCGTKMHL